jgi:uncharacterized protein involved in type VI secretion and phage assembly
MSHARAARAAQAAHTSSATRPVVEPVARRAELARASGTERRVASGKRQKSVSLQGKPRPGRYQQIERQRRNSLMLKTAGGILGAIVVLGIIYFISNTMMLPARRPARLPRVSVWGPPLGAPSD